MRLEALSPALRARYYYKVPQAGEKIGLNRSESYRAASRGEIPAEWHGKFLLVPRKVWDRRVTRLLKKAPSATEEFTTAEMKSPPR